MLRGLAASACLLILFVGVSQAQTLTCDRGTRGGTADRRTVTFDCTGTIPRGSSATSTLNWSRFLQPASRFSNARLTVNSPTPGETRVKVAGTFQGTNGNNIKTCQTRRGLILPGGGAAGPDTDLTAGAATVTIMNINNNSTATPKILEDDHKEYIKHDGYKGDEEYKRIYDDDHREYRRHDGYKGDEEYQRRYDDDHREYRRHDGYKGDEEYKRSHEYKGDEDSHDGYKKPFRGVAVVFSPVVVAPDAPPAPQKRHGDEYHGDEEDEDEYAYNGEDAEYYNVKFDDWEDASTEQAETGRFGNDVRQCRSRVSRGNGRASIATATPQQKGRLPETPAALRLTVHCKQAPQGQQNCVVRARLVVAFTGDLANVAK